MNTITLEELKNPEHISKLCHNKRLPIGVMRDDKADMVIMSASVYEEMLTYIGDADDLYTLPVAEFAEDNPISDEWLIKSIMRYAIKNGAISASMIQRKFYLGYAHASQILDFLEEYEFISPLIGIRPRKILVSEEVFLRKFEEILKERK